MVAYTPAADWQERAAQEAEAQLKELDRQSGFLPKLAHLTAGALLFAASAGSLISISAAPFARFLAELNAGRLDAVDLINLSVNLLLVLAGDVTLLYAASMLRTLRSTGAPKSETRGHTRAMWFAAGLETGTYLYLVWLFDKPTNPLLWSIAIGRAISWPIFSMYLSMARPLPVAPRDVAYNASVASGRGVVRDVTILANDPNAPLQRKVRIYRASSRMHPEDRAMFDDVIEAVSDAAPAAAVAALAPPLTEAPERPPTGPGTPVSAPVRTPRSNPPAARATVLTLTPDRAQRKAAAQARAKRQQTANGRRVRTGDAATASYEAQARTAWTDGATSVSKMMKATGMGRAAASSWVRTLKAGRPSDHPVDHTDTGQLAQ